MSYYAMGAIGAAILVVVLVAIMFYRSGSGKGGDPQ